MLSAYVVAMVMFMVEILVRPGRVPSETWWPLMLPLIVSSYFVLLDELPVEWLMVMDTVDVLTRLCHLHPDLS